MEIENIVANTVLLKAREGKHSWTAEKKKFNVFFFLSFSHLNDMAMDEPELSVCPLWDLCFLSSIPAQRFVSGANTKHIPFKSAVWTPTTHIIFFTGQVNIRPSWLGVNNAGSVCSIALRWQRCIRGCRANFFTQAPVVFFFVCVFLMDIYNLRWHNGYLMVFMLHGIECGATYSYAEGLCASEQPPLTCHCRFLCVLKSLIGKVKCTCGIIWRKNMPLQCCLVVDWELLMGKE